LTIFAVILHLLTIFTHCFFSQHLPIKTMYFLAFPLKMSSFNLSLYLSFIHSAGLKPSGSQVKLSLQLPRPHNNAGKLQFFIVCAVNV